MKRRMFIGLFVGTMFLTLMGLSNRSFAQVNINVGINVPPPPPLVIPAPPPMFVIPGTYVYFAPEVEADIFFYHGYWYRPHQGHWYRSGSYNGRWVYIAPPKVPTVLLNLPPDFRRVPPGHQRIPHEQLKKNWRTWEKEKYWENLSVNMGREKGTTEKIGDINEAKENTTIKYDCIYVHPDGVRGYLSLAAWQPRGSSRCFFPAFCKYRIVILES